MSVGVHLQSESLFCRRFSGSNTAERQRLGTSPSRFMMDRKPKTAFSVSDIDGAQLRVHLLNKINIHGDLRREVLEKSNELHQRLWVEQSRGELLHFTVGNYILVTPVRKE